MSPIILLALVCSTPGPERAQAAAPLEALRSYVHFLLAEESEDRDDALQRALDLDPTSAYLHVEKASLALQDRDVERAIAEAQKAVALDPRSVEGHALLARIFARLAQLGGEHQVVQVERAISHLEALGDLEPSGEVWQNLAEMRELHARLVPADRAADAEKALEAWSHSDDESEGRVRSARLLISLGRKEEAASLLQDELATNPDWINGRRVLGEILEETGDWEGAEAAYAKVLEGDPEDMHTRLRHARALDRLGRSRAATEEYERVIGGPAGPDVTRLALSLLGDLLERQGRYAESERRFLDLISRFPDDPDSRLDLARFYHERGRIEEADRQIQILLEGLEQDSETWFRIAVQAASLLADEGRITEAFPLIERAVEMKPDDDAASLSLIDLCLRTGDYRRAERLAGRRRRKMNGPDAFWVLEGQAILMRGAVDEGRTRLEDYLKAEGRTARGLGLVASAFGAAGLPAEAARYQAKAAEASQAAGKDPSRYRIQQAASLAGAGMSGGAEDLLRDVLSRNPGDLRAAAALLQYVLRPREDHEAALGLVREMRASRPDAPAVRLWEIEELLALGRLAEASRLLEEAREALPGVGDLLPLRMELLARQGKSGEAHAEALKAARGPSGDLSALLLLADGLRSGGALTEALELLEEGAEGYAGHPRLEFSLGAILERLGRTDEAIEHLRKAVAADPTFHGAMNYLGYTLVEHGGDLKEAKDLLDRALILDPNNAAYLDSLGWILLAMGRVQAAAGPLEEAARRVPDDAVVRMHLARLREEQDRIPEALQGYIEALQEGLDERVEETRSRVRSLGGRPPEAEEQAGP